MGEGDRLGGGPSQGWDGGFGNLRGANEEGEAATGTDQCGGGGEDRFEVFDGAKGDYVEGGGGKRFGSGVLYIGVGQCKGAGDFAEEGGFLVVGFDQGEGELRGPEFDGEAGESGAGAEVGEREFLSPLRGLFISFGEPTACAVG